MTRTMRKMRTTRITGTDRVTRTNRKLWAMRKRMKTTHHERFIVLPHAGIKQECN